MVLDPSPPPLPICRVIWRCCSLPVRRVIWRSCSLPGKTGVTAESLFFAYTPCNLEILLQRRVIWRSCSLPGKTGVTAESLFFAYTPCNLEILLQITRDMIDSYETWLIHVRHDSLASCTWDMTHLYGTWLTHTYEVAASRMTVSEKYSVAPVLLEPISWAHIKTHATHKHTKFVCECLCVCISFVCMCLCVFDCVCVCLCLYLCLCACTKLVAPVLLTPCTICLNIFRMYIHVHMDVYICMCMHVNTYTRVCIRTYIYV